MMTGESATRSILLFALSIILFFLASFTPIFLLAKFIPGTGSTYDKPIIIFIFIIYVILNFKRLRTTSNLHAFIGIILGLTASGTILFIMNLIIPLKNSSGL